VARVRRARRANARSAARAGFAAAALAAALGCGAEPPNRPNVLLVTVDTLRADRLSGYGYARKTSPYLDSLAESGVRFERAYATSSWTAPSLASLVTSLDPTVHGVEHGHLDDQLIVRQEVLPESVPLLAEELRAAGYRTFGVTANTHLYGRFGFDRGFDRYECLGFLDAAVVLRTLQEWRDGIIGGAAPWFLWVHLLDPHAPFVPRKPAIREYFPGFRPLWRPVRGVIDPEDYKRFGAEKGTRLHELINALYDGEIAFTDAAIREVAAMVGVGDGDLVVVTADHGEEFLDHGSFGHGKTLFEEVIRVPLILRLPGRAHAGRVVRGAVSLLDVFPTVLDVVGAPAPPDIQGSSLLPRLAGGAPTDAVVTVTLSRFVPLGMDSITRGSWKYIRHRVDPERRMLFDLASDPGETANLVATQPEKAAELAALLEAQLSASRSRRVEPGFADLSGEELEQLRALGYVPR
jgi:arylsulfatase A-like enzyme